MRLNPQFYVTKTRLINYSVVRNAQQCNNSVWSVKNLTTELKKNESLE
jgi:hypothetical protein